MSRVIKVSDFTRLPGARHRADGDFSADEFFEDHLFPSLSRILKDKKSKDTILLDLDGTLGYASSFVSQLAVRILEKCDNRRRIKKILSIKSTEDPGQEEGFWNEIGRK